MKQYKYKGRIYLVTECTLEDILSHIERVLSYWTSANVDIKEQTKALEEAVNNHTAFKVVNDNNETEAAIYFINMNNKHTVQSNLLFLNDKRMFAILCYYLRLTANIHKIYFKPHTKDFIPFKFIVNDSSIRLFHSNDLPLEIDLYSKKSQILYEDHYLKYNIQEL